MTYTRHSTLIHAKHWALVGALLLGLIAVFVVWRLMARRVEAGSLRARELRWRGAADRNFAHPPGHRSDLHTRGDGGPRGRGQAAREAVAPGRRGHSGSERVVYGINTGFGNFRNVVIPRQDLETLQVNLIRSHAAGVGDPFDEEIVRAILLLRVNALASGFSGVDPSTLDALVALLNKGVHPVVPKKGS